MRFLFNHCEDCGTRIPWRKRAFFGNSYKPVICTPCAHEKRVKLFGSLGAYHAAMLSAAAEEIRHDSR